MLPQETPNLICEPKGIPSEPFRFTSTGNRSSASVSIWCSTKGWDKNRQRAVFQPFILIVQVAALVLISVAKSGSGAPYDPFSLVCVPAGLVGTTLGLAFYQKLSDKQFTRTVNMLLVVSGIGFLS